MKDYIAQLARKKGLGIKEMAERAVRDGDLLALILKNTRSKNDTLRYNCYQILLELSASTPDALYPHWDALAEMLGSTNNFFKYQAVYLIANLLSADAEGRFDSISDKYFNLIYSDSIMIASHLALNAGKIARAKTELRPMITRLLLDAGKKAGGKKNGELLRSYIIEAFGEYPEKPDSAETIRAFVRDQLKSGSPKTRKIAKDFLEKNAEA